MKRTVLKTIPVALALAFACGAASADPYNDVDGFHGYFRAGAGGSSAGGEQSCYALGQPSMSYRLGNECDSYAEFGYTHELLKSANGTSWVGTIWADIYEPGSNFTNAKLGLAKAYIEARNLPFLNGGTAWIGKRYYYRPDIHFLDLQYINMNGTGGGIDKVNVGPGKLSYAIFKDNDNDIVDTATGVVDSDAAVRQNLVYEGLPVNENGTVDLAATYVYADGKGPNRHNGYQVSAFHRQAKFMGGGNTFGIQYGVGPGTGIGVGNSRMGASGYTFLDSDTTRFRVFDNVVMQATKEFSVEMVALWQRDKNAPLGNTFAAPKDTLTWTTVGARPVYAFNQNFKLQGEIGVTQLKSSSTGDTARLTKVTIAPTIAVAEDYWSRPELRLFITHGRWNDAASPLVNAANNSGPVYGANTSGTSVGLQVEAWF